MRAAAELLQREAEALPQVLSDASAEAFDRPTVLPGWSVRDVVAHCGAALGQLIRGELGGFTPEENERDVQTRRSWPLGQVIDELLVNYPGAAGVIDRLDGAADGLGLGEWVHGGDIREPLGAPDPYTSDGVELALELIVGRARDRGMAATVVDLGDRRLGLGIGPPIGRLSCDTETFVRLVAGRAPDPTRFELSGIEPADLVLFT